MGNKCCSSAAHDIHDLPSQRNTLEVMSTRNRASTIIQTPGQKRMDFDDPLNSLRQYEQKPSQNQSPKQEKERQNEKEGQEANKPDDKNPKTAEDDGYMKASIFSQFSNEDEEENDSKSIQSKEKEGSTKENPQLQTSSLHNSQTQIQLTPKDSKAKINGGNLFKTSSDIKLIKAGGDSHNSKSNSSTPIFYSDDDQPNTDIKIKEERMINGVLQYGDNMDISKSQKHSTSLYKNSSHNSSNGDFQSHYGSNQHSVSMKNVTVVSGQGEKGCFRLLSSQVFAHEWLVQDIIDKKQISDSLVHNQVIIDISEVQEQTQENLLKQGISSSQKFASLTNNLPKEFYDRIFYGCLYQYEDLKYFGKQSADKLLLKAFFLNTQAYTDNEEYLSQTVAYQSQILKLIDNAEMHPLIEEEIFLVDASSEDCPIVVGYLVFTRQPQLNLYQIVKDSWLRPKSQNPLGAASDSFSREKLIFYLLQVMSIVIKMHQQGYATFASVIPENIFYDPIQQKLKFSSPFMGCLKPINVVRGQYSSQQMTQDSQMTKKSVKTIDQKQIAQVFYQICQVMQCKDEFVGQLLRDLVDSNQQLWSIFQKYDQKILESDPLFYYKLGEQFYQERKTKASLEILQVYEKIIGNEKQAPKYANVKSYLQMNDNKFQLGMIHKILGEVYKDVGDINKSLQNSQRALSILSDPNSGIQEVKRHEKSDLDEELRIKNKINLLKQQIGGPPMQDDKLLLHPLFADIMFTMGLSYILKQEQLKALYFLFRSYKKKLRIDGPYHFGQQKALICIANILKDLKLQSEAIHYYERLTLTFTKYDNPRDYIDQLNVFAQLAQLHKEKLNFEECKRYNKQAIDLIENKMAQGKDISRLNPQHIAQLSSFYNQIATAISSIGITQESIQYFDKSYQMAKIAFGENSDKTVNQIMNLGQAYLKIKEYQSAIQYLEQGINQKQKLNIPIKPEHAIVDKLKLCEAYKGYGNYEQCIKLYTDLIIFTKHNLPARIEQLAAFNQELGKCYLRMLNNLKALEKVDNSLKLYSQKIEKHNEIYIKVLLLKAHILLQIANGDKNNEQVSQVRKETATLISEVFKNSKLFDEYSDGISDHIFDDTESCDLLLELFGPFEKEQLFREGRAKEKWRILVIETHHLVEKEDEEEDDGEDEVGQEQQNDQP